MSHSPRRRLLSAGVTTLAVSLLASLGGLVETPVASAAAPTPAAVPTPAPVHGGDLTVLENSGFAGAWPAGLDPATDTSDDANLSYMDAIYGGLFEQGPQNQVIPDLATGYKLADGGKTVDIFLRHGVHFSDGSPFDAAAVKFSIDRVLDPKNANACGCVTNFPISNITTDGQYEVVLHMKQVFGPIIGAFFNEGPNWIISERAFKRMGEKAFSQHPVGAGPFTVSSDQLSTQLVLKRNADYWQHSKPYLNSITFKVVGTDQSAIEGIQAGQAQMYQGYATLANIHNVEKEFTVSEVPATAPDVVQLNTKIPPFNNIKAREAIYYATDSPALNKALTFGVGQVTQSMTGPGGLFFEPRVAGYRTYDPKMAEELSKELGGLRVNLNTIALGAAAQLTEALAAEWNNAGIRTTINNQNLNSLIKSFQTGNWQAMLQTTGGYDPALGYGLTFRYESTAPFTGVHDKNLDRLINQATSTLAESKRGGRYHQIFREIAQKAYSPFIYVTPGFNVSAKNVYGPGVSINGPQANWEDVFMTSS